MASDAARTTGRTERLTQFERDGLTFDVTDSGPLDGPVVVLLHGFPTDRSSWDRISPLLHAAGLRTLAPDQRGYSPGARPQGRAAYRLGTTGAAPSPGSSRGATPSGWPR